jgi:hypothetical protein
MQVPGRPPDVSVSWDKILVRKWLLADSRRSKLNLQVAKAATTCTEKGLTGAD